jgi:flavin reductase
VTEIIDKGTHSVVFAEVAGIRTGSQHEAGLVYFGRDYHAVGRVA